MSIEISPLELDYLKFNGDLMHFDASRPKHRKDVISYMEGAGLENKKSGDDWIYFENSEMGIRAFFSNFPMNNKKISKSPTLSIDFTGHFFIKEHAYTIARKLMKYFIEEFGTFFKVSRVDIRQDIYGAKYPFDYFPDFTKRENKLVWALRSKPEHHLYYNESPTCPATGFTIKTSRYRIMSYNRNISLSDKLRRGEITKDYFDHYNKIYKGRDVQRLEICLKQDACKTFALLFFNSGYKKDKVLRLVMANFARNHALKEIEPRKSLQKMKVNEIFSELFFYQEKESLKYFRADLEEKTGLTLSEATFSQKGRTIEEMSKMISKKICEISEGNQFRLEELKKRVLSLIEHHEKEFIGIIAKRKERFKNSLKFMEIDPEHIIQLNRPMYQYAS